ncbi:membrane protein [Gordonia phage MScarn]|uniref:Membrane protein n=2 Tax=Emalynvirus troje TaxID=2560511 RepID=A0A8F3EDV3_9CAUD|nr:hypothetical protein SEA_BUTTRMLKDREAMS_40 [Gordonia phage Buttrmlkdreams]QWY84912.1 membrane protein [Gordonia phage MScarn]WKW85104.1 membrane protein [Gordonia phage Yummy]WKW86915.1 membrane protein [Gordonia phage Horseradish]
MKESAASSSLLPTLLLVAFVVLKLCGVIAWSWWWVLSPLWIPALLVFATLLIGGIGTAVIALWPKKD